MQGAAGMLRHPDGLLRELRRLADEYGILLIADEVAVGMGRTGKLFACQQEDVIPDIICIGKGLSGGYLPISATIANTEIFDAFKSPYHRHNTLFHGHTYSGNPLAAAAALANLKLFDELQTLTKLPPLVDQMAHRLQLMLQHPNVGDVRQYGMLAGVELVTDKSTRQAFPGNQEVGRKVCREALKHKVWLRPLGNVLIIVPPLIITESEVDLLFDGLNQALESILPTLTSAQA